jgi:hypothetical protein
MIRPLHFLLLFVTASRSKEPFKPKLGPDLPAITVSCGDVSLLLRQASQWTPRRIDFRGHAMTTERSAYGTVFSFPDCGFIGTAHLENEPEPLKGTWRMVTAFGNSAAEGWESAARKLANELHNL